MFTQPVSPPLLRPQPSTVSPSPARQSRLRGLSYLRNYTHNHLLSRDSHTSNTSSNSNSSRNSPPRTRSGGLLTRSASFTPTATTTATATTISRAAANPNRLTLVTPLPLDSSWPTHLYDISSAPASLSIPGVGCHPERDPSHSPDQTASADDGPSTMTRDRAAEAASGLTDTQPSIRFSAYYDPRSTRPSLSFPPISRTLPTGSEAIRVGRYSERDSLSMANLPNLPSAAPVGFKSKVVSRRHCEFWHENGKWYIKDVKSSSGTFLNHIRLSPPSQESKAFPVNDGDIVQLGIDFKGGEEMIFRCVKMRLELNRGWQNKLNTFNMAAHKRLRTMTSTNGASAASSNSQDCSICLNSIAPCQSLFVAPCSHTWHFKCVRSLLTSPQYPIFICPNCRAGADLEADVEDPTEDWQNLEDVDEEKEEPEACASGPMLPTPKAIELADATVHETDAIDVTMNIGSLASLVNRSTPPYATSEPLTIRNPSSSIGQVGHLRDGGTPSPPGGGAEGPITPSNNAGPWVFDGRAGRLPADPAFEMRSLDAAADIDTNTRVPSDSISR